MLRDNDVEFFLAFDRAYYEFEINPLGTIYEGLFGRQSGYEKNGFAKIPELNRSLEHVPCIDFNGVFNKIHYPKTKLKQCTSLSSPRSFVTPV